MPPPKTSKKKKPEGVVIEFNADGIDYRCDLTAITNRDELDLFDQSGLPLQTLTKAMTGSPPPFALAAVMFLARRQAGDRVATYDALLDSIDRFDITLAPADKGDAPEA